MRLHLSAVAGMALALTATTPAAAAPTAIYGGHTSDFAPFSLRVGANGSKLTGMLLQVDFRCDDGGGASWSGAASFQSFKPATVEPGDNVLTPARISRRGTFRATGEATATYGVDNKIGAISETLRGTVRRGSAHGTYSATLVMRDAGTGATVRTCRTGAVRWEARSKPGRVYAGLASSGEPLVIERSPDGGRVRVLWVAWSAPCSSGGAFEIGQGLTNFTISKRGRFGDSWSDEEKGDDGVDVRAYTFDGSVGAASASGTFGVQITRKDAAGATTETCESPLARWTARSTKGAKVKRPRSEIRVGP